VNFQIGEPTKSPTNSNTSNSNNSGHDESTNRSTTGDLLTEIATSNSGTYTDATNQSESLRITENVVPSCYICFKVNHNKNVVQCPMARKMKNKLKSEFWFQIYDDW
jgi:hypothetical protein